MWKWLKKKIKQWLNPKPLYTFTSSKDIQNGLLVFADTEISVDFICGKLHEGETIFELSKKYNIPASSIEEIPYIHHNNYIKTLKDLRDFNNSK